MTAVLAIGDVTLDLILGPVHDMPRWGAEIDAPGAEMRLGGNIGNFAVAARRLGLDVDCTSIVGDDENGRTALRELGSLGCTTTRVRAVAGGATCISVGIFRDDGERLFVTYPGVLETLGEHLANVQLPAADVAFFSGWCQPPRVEPDTLTPLFATLSASGTPIAFDLSWHDETWRDKDALIEVLSRTDFVLLNRDELAALVGAPSPDQALEALAVMLGERPTIVVKAGADGAFAKRGAGSTVRAAVPVASTASAVGAGDAFNAAFLAATFGDDRDLASAIEEACRFATATMKKGRKRVSPNNLDPSRSTDR